MLYQLIQKNAKNDSKFLFCRQNQLKLSIFYVSLLANHKGAL